MPDRSKVPNAIVVSGLNQIQKLLEQEGAIIKPAYAVQMLDGFVNDTFTEYANPSIYRPNSVCRLKAVSTLKEPARQAGNYTFGFTMYTTAGYDETIEIWIGHRQIALAKIPDPDNRVHLFLAPKKFNFKSGESLRLVTSPTTGPYRIEKIVFLPKHPRPEIPKLEIISPHVELRQTNGEIQAYLTWITNRPAFGRLNWGTGRNLSQRQTVSGPLANHEIILDNLELKRVYQYKILMQDRTGKLEALHTGKFKTNLFPPKSRTKKGRIPLLARRSSPTSDTWPVSVGVPFPKGGLGNDTEIRLLGENHTEVPLQARAMTHWEDGSVRWALLDFKGTGKENFTVEYGSKISRTVPRDALDIFQSKNSIVVTTGPIRIQFLKDSVIFPGIVSLRQPDGTYQRLTPIKPTPAVTLISDNGETYQTKKPTTVVLEESGPERACIRIEMTHCLQRKALFKSILRINLFRGSETIQSFHTFENNRTEDDFTFIRELSLRSDLNMGTETWGQIGPYEVNKLKAQEIILQQKHDRQFLVTQGRRTLTKGKRINGNAKVSGKRGEVSIAVRDFWQNYPKGLCVDKNGITVQICPPLKRNTYPKGDDLEDRLYYYLLEGRYKFKYGVSRTHEIWMHIQPGQSISSAFATSVQKPPLYSTTPTAFNRSQITTPLPPKENSPLPSYELWVDSARQAYEKNREFFRAYGMLNYGDWYGERAYNWGNVEYDTPWAFLQEYLRGGHSDFYTWAEEAARHFVDVDTCHYSPNSKTAVGLPADQPRALNIGEQYFHCVGHVGNYYPEGYREKAFFEGRSLVSHTWVEGLFLFALLSGNNRVLEGAMKTCEVLAGEILNDYDFTNCRNNGWHIIHLMAAYKATGRKLFLNGAQIIIDRSLERQRPTGGWERLQVSWHCQCDPPRHMGNVAFLVSILIVGLKRYHEATGHQRIANSIIRAADYLINTMWDTKKKAFRRTSCPKSGIGFDIRLLKGIAIAYAVSGAKRFKNILLEDIRNDSSESSQPTEGAIGKTISGRMRSFPAVLSYLPKRTKKIRPMK